jgi:hypothetical protein
MGDHKSSSQSVREKENENENELIQSQRGDNGRVY